MHSIEHQLPPHLQDNEHYIIAHMSPLEIEELSKIQGGKVIDPKTGYHSFLPLGEVLGHQRFTPYLERFKNDYMANAGNHEQGLEAAIRKSGRYGDTEGVILPRQLADIFDNLLYGGQQPGNPETGKREYFLGGFLNSIGNMFKPLTNFISPIVGKIGSAIQGATSGISNALFNQDPNSIQSVTQQAAGAAPAVAGMAAPLISQGVSALGQRMGLSPETSQSIGGTIGDTAGGLIKNFGQSMGGGGVGEQQPGAVQSPSSLDLLKQGAGSLLQKALPTLGNMAQSGASQLAERIKPGMGTAVGQIAQGLVNNVGGSVANSLQSGQNPNLQDMGNSALDSVTGYARDNLSNIQNPMGRMAGEGALNTISNMRGGASPLDALRNGVTNISPETMEGAQNYASSGISSMLDSILPAAEEALPMVAL